MPDLRGIFQCCQRFLQYIGRARALATDHMGPKIQLYESREVCNLFVPQFIIFAAKSLQLCPTLCDPIDGSPLDSPVPRILQARTREWVAISFSNAWKWKVKVKSLSRARLLATPWTAAHQAPPSMGFSRQEYWSGLPFPSPTHESEKWKWNRSVVSDS